MSEVNDSFLEASNEFLHKINKEITRFNQKQNSWQHLSLLFSKRYGKKIQINSQIFLEALLNLILSVQVISLVYDPNSTIGN